MNGLLRERFLRLRRSHLAQYALLSADPPVLAVLLHGDQIGDFVEKYRRLLDPLRGEPVHCFALFGCAVTPYILGQVEAMEGAVRAAFPDLRLTYVCNTPEEPAWFAARGAEAFFCSRNCFRDERLYRPLPDLPRRFDAIYDARFIPVKRHQLAERVDRLALIYYPHPDDDPGYVQGVQRRLAHAHFFNHGSGGRYRLLGPEDVNRALNQCRVGLALSEDEGAMMAAVQYLLCGLPVVTTPSRGGRGVWFEESFVRVVPPDPDAVREAVMEMAAREIPPEEIRRATLTRLLGHRRVFVTEVQKVYDRLAVSRSFAAEWEGVFVNGLVNERNHAETLDRIRRAREVRPGSIPAPGPVRP